jgi:hypothetical protein
MLITGGVTAGWHGTRNVPPVRFTAWLPDPPDSIYCEECGQTQPRESIETLRLAEVAS